MRRREFITLLGGAAVAWPRAAWAQQAPRVRTVGVILPYPQNDPQSQARAKAFSFGLQQAGSSRRTKKCGPNFAGRQRSPSVSVSIPPTWYDCKRMSFVANSTPVVSALLQETHTVPIVFVSVTDPVGQGCAELRAPRR